MSQKQSFADFLASGSPYGGKNRGRGGSSRGRGGGGREGFYGNASKKAYNADYSNVPFDYDKINSQHYKKLEPASVAPYGHRDTSSSHSGPDRNVSSSSSHVPRLAHTPGTATPNKIHGLGFHTPGQLSESGSARPSIEVTKAKTRGSSRGLNGTCWGGGLAPLFIKAGELFKDGEVDVITHEEDKGIDAGHYHMPGASGTRMTDTKHQANVRTFQAEDVDNTSDAVTDGKGEQLKISNQSGSSLSPAASDDSSIFQVVQYTGELSISPSDTNSHQDPVERDGSWKEQVMELPVSGEDQVTGLNTSTKPGPDIVSSFNRREHVDRVISEADSQSHQEDTLFFIDTNPDPDSTPCQTPQYNTIIAPPIGASSPDSDEEDIVFVPRAYNQQKAIGPYVSSLHLRHGMRYQNQGSSKYQSYVEIIDDLNAQPLLGATQRIQSSAEDATSTSQPPQVSVSSYNEELPDSILSDVNAPAASYTDEKMTKRQKKRVSKNAKRLARRAAARGVPRDDSDIEWGSDGPPKLAGGEQDRTSVSDLVGGGKAKESEAILRDYLEGVRLSQMADEDEDKSGDDDDMAALSKWANRINVLDAEANLDEDSDEESSSALIEAGPNEIYHGPQDKKKLGQDEKDDDELRELEALRSFANRIHDLDEGQDLSEDEEITLVQPQAPKISLKLQGKRREQQKRLGDGDVPDEELMELEALQEFVDRINGQGNGSDFSGDDMGEIEEGQNQPPSKARVKQVKFSSYNQEITHEQWEADEEKLALDKWALRVNTLGGDDCNDDYEDEDMGVSLSSQLDSRRQPRPMECSESSSEQDEEEAELYALDAWVSRVNSHSQGRDLSDDELDTAYAPSKPKLKKEALPKMKQITPPNQSSLYQQPQHVSAEELSQPTELRDSEAEAEATEDNPWALDPKEAEGDNPWAAKEPKKEHNPWSGEVIYEERTFTQSTSLHPRPHNVCSADVSSDLPQKQYGAVVCSPSKERLAEQRSESEDGGWSHGKTASKALDEVHGQEGDSEGDDSSGSSTSEWRYFEDKQEGDMFNGANHWSEGNGSEDDSDEEGSEIGGENDSDSDSHDESEEHEEDEMEVDDYDQTEWFINAMEDALDGKGINFNDPRAKMFNTVNQDSYEFSPTPAKKGKKSKQLKGIPMELQVQWEKDRQTKAEKKRQRELARHLEEFESTIVSGSSRNGKKKRYAKKGGKDSKQIYQASVAHLIPGSAADVADMFSEEEGLSDSENEEYYRPSDRGEMVGVDSFSPSLKPKNARFSMGFKKNKKRSLGKKAAVGPEWRTLDWVDDLIQAFLKDKKSESMSLPPMDKEGRKKIHMLAECYGVGSTSRGSGKKKSISLYKTKRSGADVKEERRERLLTAAPFSGSMFHKTLYAKSSHGGAKTKGRDWASGATAKPREGELVGHGADKIGTDNVGHKLLSKMGWAEGNKIGRGSGSGIDAPIVAVVKNTKSGLGA